MHLSIAEKLKHDAFVGQYTKVLMPSSQHPASAADQDIWPPDVDINVETETQGDFLLVISFSENLNTSFENLNMRALKVKEMPWGKKKNVK